MDLMQYKNEIIAIAEENHVSFDIGLNMFVNNIQDAEMEGDPYFYHGADELDYKALKVEWDKLTDTEKNEAMNEFCDWYRANRLKQ